MKYLTTGMPRLCRDPMKCNYPAVSVPLMMLFRLEVPGAVFATPEVCIINKIEIRPIDALFEVLGISSFSIYLVFQFERYSNLSDIQF